MRGQHFGTIGDGGAPTSKKYAVDYSVSLLGECFSTNVAQYLVLLTTACLTEDQLIIPDE